jgi:hypothetical protein
MFMSVSSFRVPARRFAGLDGLVSGVFGDQLPHAAVQLLPVPNEIAGVIVSHCLGSFIFEDRKHDPGLRPIPGRLSQRYFFECVGDAIELLLYPRPDLFRPLDLTGGACQSERHNQPFWLGLLAKGKNSGDLT